MYRCKNLTIRAWAYAKVQNKKECATKMYIGANI